MPETKRRLKTSTRKDWRWFSEAVFPRQGMVVVVVVQRLLPLCTSAPHHLPWMTIHQRRRPNYCFTKRQWNYWHLSADVMAVLLGPEVGDQGLSRSRSFLRRSNHRYVPSDIWAPFICLPYQVLNFLRSAANLFVI